MDKAVQEVKDERVLYRKAEKSTSILLKWRSVGNTKPYSTEKSMEDRQYLNDEEEDILKTKRPVRCR